MYIGLDDLPPVMPFAFLEAYILKTEANEPFDDLRTDRSNSLFESSPRETKESNARAVTRTCLELGLGEDDELLQEEVVQEKLSTMVCESSSIRGIEPHSPCVRHLPVRSEHVARNVKRILYDSHTVRARAMLHLQSKGNEPWQIALATWHEKDRDTLFDPIVASSDETSLNNLEQIFNTWMEEAWPFLDRLERLLLDIYGNDRSAQTIAEKLQTDQVVYFWEPVVKSNSMLGQLMDVCRMWNDTIASAKVQKLLFSKGLETC
jgi:hypothetical protein